MPVPSPSPPVSLPTPKSKVFVVHGHDLGVLTEVENFVLKANRKPVVLKNVSRPGRNLLDELLEHSKGISFAIVILSENDVGRAMEEKILPLGQ